jgi:DNA-binding LacI/PurR family transcriptional regulator
MTPTLETIAKRCGVSKVTVSLALRGSLRISAGMRARIAEVSTEVGYVPNPMVSALMASIRSNRKSKFICNLAFITAFPERRGWRENPSFLRYHVGAKARALSLGYGMDVYWMGEKENYGPELSKFMSNRGVLGLLLSPLPEYGTKLGLRWKSFSTVAFGHTFHEVPAHRVTNSQFHTVFLALDECLARGHRRIGLAMPKFVNEKVGARWLAGYLGWQSIHPQETKITPLIVDQLDETTFVAWVRKEKPDAVIANHGPVLTWLRTNGWRVPEDISFIHLNWTPEKGEISGPNQQPEEIGAAAVDLLVEEINQNRRGVPITPKTITLESKWHEGTTCPTRPR